MQEFATIAKDKLEELRDAMKNIRMPDGSR